MAPRSKVANISFTVESASEDEMTVDELNAVQKPESNGDTKATGRKARGSAAQSKAGASTTKAPAKGRSAARATNGTSATVAKKSNGAVKKATTKAGRKALVEEDDANGSDSEEAADVEEEEPAPQAKPTKRGRPAKKVQEEEKREEESVPAPAKRGRKAVVKEGLEKETKSKTTAKSRGTKRALESEPEPEQMTIPETQPELDTETMDISESIEIEEIPESMPPPVRPSARRAHAQPNSRARRTSAGVRRTGSVSDSERDPIMRRKLGELTKKLDAMTAKYEALKEAASSGKESNFDQLKKRTDQIAKDQDAVIKSLKQQVSDTQSRTADLASLKKELAAASKESARLAAENKKLAESLTATQNENKTLSSKLAAARSSSTIQPDVKTVPGSAVKPRTTGVVLPGTVEAAKEATLARQKVDLYSDLTNLVVLSVKKSDEGDDVYDCLQTGRGRTLHFHLTVAPGSSPSEETEFIYQPLLDEQRDKELLDILPDYLTEEICFPSAQAVKFYCKVLDSMNKKVVLEEEDESEDGGE
ncbi:hypothetical protein GGP41_003077 [Bipolaris sorokiniana]|uniref:Monopolin complex subunit Csm1/Pcs1 C-terminal domain-containing protein n=2 Tax=Cochliobolus sativus TaxID=45130 RepID=A0A8H6DRV5_COCSA|nr:hypothetical protein GGP41_003077 [Bipolaris sorokiniana]